MALGAGVLVLGAASAACAQAPGAPAMASSGIQVLLLPEGSAPASVEGQAPEKILREIDDPHTGDRWLLVRNGECPGGPGRLMRVTARRYKSGGAALRVAGQPEDAVFQPVIRAGDRLIVEEHSARVDAVLEARALNPAAAGTALDVRLAIGGKVVRVVALGPGRAALQAEAGVRP